MESLNQVQYNEFNTIPDVGRTEDISIGVWDGFDNHLGSLEMGFDLPDALSPEAVETTVTTAALENFVSDPDTEVIVAPELIVEINEIGRRVLASYIPFETDEPLPDEELDLAEPVETEEPIGEDSEPLIYVAREDSSSQTIADPEEPLIDESPEDSMYTSMPNGAHILDLFVELDTSAEPDSPVVTPEEPAFSKSESDVYHNEELTPYLGSFGMNENIDLILIDEPESAAQAYSSQLTAEEQLAAESIEMGRRNQTLIYANSL